MSHPTWVRGLKLVDQAKETLNLVAPYVGAWIETIEDALTAFDDIVAPYVGAWIETWRN